jgi:protein-tyrosine-phosphatase
MKKKFKIFFVCTGNVCRSPMAVGLLKAKMPKHLKSKVIIESTGTMGIENSPASAEAIEVMREKGIDITDHRSQGVNHDVIKDTDIIFALAQDHRYYLESSFPDVRDNIFLLKTFGRNPDKVTSYSVSDPIGGTLETYMQCRDTIEQEIDRILPRLTRLIEESVEGKR